MGDSKSKECATLLGTNLTRALVVHSTFDELGGAETFCLRVVAMLQKRFDEVIVVHATANTVDFDKIARWCGVHLDPSRVRSEPAAPPGRSRVLAEFRSRYSLLLLRYSLAVGRARVLAPSADLLVSTFAECPIDAPRMIQAIHAPMLALDQDSLGYLGLSHRRVRWLAHVGYLLSVRVLMRWSRARIGNHLTITNSEWTAGQFRRHYPARDVRPIHFGVQTSLTSQSPLWVPFAQRESNFVILGRVVPAKRIQEALDIVSRLRAIGYMVGLRIIGVASEPYATEVRRLIASMPWVFWHANLVRDELEAFVVRQKWGLHCFRHEHYGFAPAELQRLGCITFVHDSGGQREIIRNSAQRYTDTDDAVHKIDAVLRAPQTHDELLNAGRISAAEHTVEAFERRFIALIDEVISR